MVTNLSDLISVVKEISHILKRYNHHFHLLDLLVVVVVVVDDLVVVAAVDIVVEVVVVVVVVGVVMSDYIFEISLIKLVNNVLTMVYIVMNLHKN
jgi:hypothetical protein